MARRNKKTTCTEVRSVCNQTRVLFELKSFPTCISHVCCTAWAFSSCAAFCLGYLRVNCLLPSNGFVPSWKCDCLFLTFPLRKDLSSLHFYKHKHFACEYQTPGPQKQIGTNYFLEILTRACCLWEAFRVTLMFGTLRLIVSQFVLLI